MKKLKKVKTPLGWSAMGMLDVNSTNTYRLVFSLTYSMQGLVGLTNGIIRDERVFHIDDPNWLSMYNEQGSPILLS